MDLVTDPWVIRLQFGDCERKAPCSLIHFPRQLADLCVVVLSNACLQSNVFCYQVTFAITGAHIPSVPQSYPEWKLMCRKAVGLLLPCSQARSNLVSNCMGTMLGVKPPRIKHGTDLCIRCMVYLGCMKCGQKSWKLVSSTKVFAQDGATNI